MSGSSEWRQQGEGPHPTLGGNLFDPRVAADGQKGGIGVGGASESTIKAEAREHIDSRGASSNYDNSSRGLDAGINRGEPGAYQQHHEGIQHIKHASGAGTSGDAPFGSGRYAESERREYEESRRAREAELASHTGTSTSSFSRNDKDVTTGTHPETSPREAGAGGPGIGREGNAATADSRNSNKDSSKEKTFGSSPTVEQAMNDSDGKGGPPDSIPTAGGERIGTKHWGESKIIPAVPQLSEEDKKLQQNTEKNTTGAGSSEHKESLIEKIKEKLHV